MVDFAERSLDERRLEQFDLFTWQLVRMQVKLAKLARMQREGS